MKYLKEELINWCDTFNTVGVDFIDSLGRVLLSGVAICGVILGFPAWVITGLWLDFADRWSK